MLLLRLQKVVLPFKRLYNILKFEHSNERYWAVPFWLCYCILCCAKWFYLLRALNEASQLSETPEKGKARTMEPCQISFTYLRFASYFRTCGEEASCKQICTDQKLRQQGPTEVQNLTWGCTESIHVYKRQPSLADNYDEDTDSHKLGLALFRHHSCTVSECGPNYCCCTAVAL